MKLSEKIQEALREQQEINLSDPAVQKRLAAQWGYVPAGAQPAPIEMSITTGALSEMFLSLDGHDKAQPGYEWRKGWNDAIRQAMDYAQPAPSVPDFADTMDAARYRWLRENGQAHEKRESRAVLPRGGKKALMAFRYWATPEELDMTIDAMLAAAPKPEAKP